MYHLSSSSLRNLFTTGDPISALSHEFAGPKPNTNPLEEEEEEEDGDDNKEEESDSSEMGDVGFRVFEFELGSMVEFWSVSLSVLVSGFVEQRVRQRRLFLGLEFEA
jgi:hypothetical protein